MKSYKNLVQMKAMFLLAYLPSHSLGYLYDLESNREQFLYKLKAHDIFYKKFLNVFIAFNTESELENIINLLLASQVLMKSKARSIALASAVKNDESSGIRCILLWLSVITAQPTFESSFDPSV